MRRQDENIKYFPNRRITFAVVEFGSTIQAYKTGVWTLVEVVELRTNRGHTFMGISERDANGADLAKTSAVIWQSTANNILPDI